VIVMDGCPSLPQPGLAVNFSYAIVKGRSKVMLREATLIEANLTWANLREANLTKANLSKANLAEAYLENANLHGSDLSEACLEKANLHKARYSSQTKWPEAFDPSHAGVILEGSS